MRAREMNGNGRWISESVLVVFAFYGTACAQQGAAVPSSLDQSAQVTSRGPRTPAGSAGPIALPDDFTKVRLASGDVLQLEIFDAPEMTQRLSVDDMGDLDVPLAGRIHVDGDTLREAEQKIAGALVSKQMMNAPVVTLEITAFVPHSVLVAGEVQQPGKIQALAPRPLLDVIASAGGVTTAAGGDIEIHHPKPDSTEDVRHIPYANGKEPMEAQAALVYPGDSVFVRRAGVIYVLGAVYRPGGYLMVNGGELTVTQAISLASGTTPVAATSGTIIVRKQGNALVQLHPELSKAQRGELVPMALLDGDMVYVPNSKLKSALINSSTVLSSAASAGIYAAANR
jgi:polysaccharide export outer membrane protein